MTRRTLGPLVLLAALALPAAVAASGPRLRDLQAREVPPALEEWIPWVIAGHEERLCPWLDGSVAATRCAWPGTLQLDLTETGGRFTQSWEVLLEGRVPLPGDGTRWPMSVEVDGRPAVVIEQGGRPSVVLDPGRREIRGAFAWSGLPEQLGVPAGVGIVQLRVRGEVVPFPRLAGGALLLSSPRRSEDEERAAEERLEISVHRLVSDGVPVRMTTRILLDVSGLAREVLLAPALPPGFTAHGLRSPVPARLEADGRLRVQVRPGRWELWVEAHHRGRLESLAFTEPQGPWAPNEVWTFHADPSVRLVEPTGVAPVDPRQTTLPDAWKSFPGWRLFPGDGLRFVERRRGDEEPAADRIGLHRTAWLDFDGQGWTVRDRLTGRLHRSWRLDVAPDLRLGRVTLAGEDQLITRVSARDTGGGVEVRQADLALLAESRIAAPQRDLPAVGWLHDVDDLGTELWLPTGWRVLAARGADRVTGSWLDSWDLLDLFLCAVALMAALRLRGPRWAAVAALTLALTWPEPLALRWTWLWLLVVVALAEALPAGRFQRVAAWLVLFVGACALILGTPFVVREARMALHPALERPGQRVGPFAGGEMATRAPAAAEPSQMNRPAMQRRTVPEDLRRVPGSAADEGQPQAVVQTGPGIPSWTWGRVHLAWSGPVRQDQRVRLWLQPPWLGRAFSALRCALVIALAFGLLRPKGGNWRRLLPTGGATASIVLLLLGLACLLPSRAAVADVPPPAVLDQLRERVLAAPDCAPSCAAIASLLVDATDDELRLVLAVAASESVAVPLPGSADAWLPARIDVAGEPAAGSVRHGATLWVIVPSGLSTVVATGPIPPAEELRLALPEKPHRVTHRLSGWRLDGVAPDGAVDDVLQLTRLEREAAPEPSAAEVLVPGELPPLLLVKRTLRLKLTWEMMTVVERLSPVGTPVLASIPLLPGESVVTEGVRVEDGRALVRLAPGSRSAGWSSSLPQADALTLTAAPEASWSERWELVHWPQWHVEWSGIPPVLAPGQGTSRTVAWAPWPGEEVRLAVTEPAGATGRTLTIDSVELEARPGSRATDVSLTLSLRSSRGGAHELRVPAGAELTALQLDGRDFPTRHEAGRVRVPLHPGSQQVHLAWRQPDGVGALLRTPRIDVGAPAVNATLRVHVPPDRWLLWTWGPRLGPAVLYWSLLPVLAAAAWTLARIRSLPLSTWKWLLLLVGLSQVPIVAAGIVVVWFLLVLWRRGRGSGAAPALFDLFQVVLALWTVVMLVVLFGAVHQGLLDHPEMHVEGNGSHGRQLVWFADRTPAELPTPLAASVPLFAYRLLMLAWALWLAASLVGWLRWAWSGYGQGGLWKKLVPREPTPAERAARERIRAKLGKKHASDDPESRDES